jgi:hypothetical protein
MAEQNAIHKLEVFKTRWISYQLLADLLIAANAGILVGSVLYFTFGLAAWYGVLVFALVLIPLIIVRQEWKLTPTDVSRFLNTIYPELEESCELVIKPQGSLNLLESLQRSKIEQALNGIEQPSLFTRRLKLSAILLLMALLFCFAMSKVPYRWKASSISESFDKNTGAPVKGPEKVLPQIASVQVRITPPAYTGKASRSQGQFAIDAEEGSRVSWEITTNTGVNSVQLLINEKETVALHPTNSDKTEWSAQKEFDAPGFYQVKVEDKLSDYYKIDVIKDTPPVIRIKTPKQYTYIDAGESTKVPLSLTLTDDYGVTDALIYATIAKGSGEAVKFKEQKINFDASFAAHQKQYDLQKMLDLKALTLEPGDELYFYIQAQDNHNQQTRTDVYIISIQDTAQLLSMNGMTMGVSLVPEYFRSERQIIIDSEKLLKDKDTISAQSFKDRSNNLGIDQKLLRLRYGKFLGEEEESNEGGGHDVEELSNIENFSNAQKVLDAYTDKHDNAEDAGFLEKDTKTQLKNTLTEMWKAELNLRTFRPQDALPFEYKALRLLKDLQQKSRAYVAKTAFNPPPLKMVEKRLSGDLTKIGQPLLQQDIKQNTDTYADLKKAASVLDVMKQTRAIAPADMHTLQMAGVKLSSLAIEQPAVYLSAVTAMHHILSATATQNISLGDINKVETALQKALPASVKLPQSGQTSADMGLSQSYYKNLSHLNSNK